MSYWHDEAVSYGLDPSYTIKELIEQVMDAPALLKRKAQLMFLVKVTRKAAAFTIFDAETKFCINMVADFLYYEAMWSQAK